jgi:cytoskeletal protein RodZ
MNNEKDKGLDDLFRKKLEDPVDEAGYREGDWDALEQMLDKHKKRSGIVYWLPILSSVAAILLLVLGWWALRQPVTLHHTKNNLQAANHKQANTGTNGGSKQQPIASDNQKTSNQKASHATNLPATNLADNSNSKKSGNKALFTSSADSDHRTAGSDQGGVKGVINNKSNEANNNADEILMAENIVPVFKTNQIDAQQINLANVQQPVIANTGLSAPKTEKIKMHAKQSFHPQYALSVLAAPDINGVGSFQQSKLGTNEGLLFSAGIFKKLTISTGVIYSDKPYITPFEDYHTPYQFAVDPVNVATDCRMLDIPINIGYQVYNKHQNKISIGTGLSSYIMLRENYTFNYASATATGPAYFDVPNIDKYFFGILNLNATYEHQLNSRVGISFQPYLKLPLTNIGYSQVRLQTTGVAVGLTWHLSSFSKP